MSDGATGVTPRAFFWELYLIVTCIVTPSELIKARKLSSNKKKEYGNMYFHHGHSYNWLLWHHLRLWCMSLQWWPVTFISNVVGIFCNVICNCGDYDHNCDCHSEWHSLIIFTIVNTITQKRLYWTSQLNSQQEKHNKYSHEQITNCDHDYDCHL